MWDRKERPWCRLCTGLLKTEAAGHAPYGVRETNDIWFMMDISGPCCLVTQGQVFSLSGAHGKNPQRIRFTYSKALETRLGLSHWGLLQVSLAQHRPALDNLSTTGSGLRAEGLTAQLGPCRASAARGPSKLGAFRFLRKGVRRVDLQAAFLEVEGSSGSKFSFTLKRVFQQASDHQPAGLAEATGPVTHTSYQNIQGTCDFLLVRPYQCFATNTEHKPIGRVMPMGRWSKAAGGARKTASLRQGSNILLPS